MSDKGEPPLSSTGQVAIFVEDVNNHEPIFIFPSDHDNTVIVLSDSVPGTNVSQVKAIDGDEGINAKISYFIADGNKGDLFAIVEHSGEIILNRRITLNDDSHYGLIIKAQDGGRPQHESRAKLYIKITFTNITLAQSRAADAEAKRYMIIAGVVAGVTVVISVIIVTIILFIRRTDFSRRQHAVKSSGQDDGSAQRDVGTWQDTSCEDIKAGFRDSSKSIERLYKPRMTGQTFELEPADSEQVAPDAYYPQTALHRYGNQDFFTFGKVKYEQLSFFFFFVFFFFFFYYYYCYCYYYYYYYFLLLLLLLLYYYYYYWYYYYYYYYYYLFILKMFFFFFFTNII